MLKEPALADRFAAATATMPIIAVLRGVQPGEAEDVATVLYEAGLRLLEVPLNSPDPLASIGTMRRVLPRDALVGAGTVLFASSVADIAAAGGELVFSPCTDVEVIRAAKAAGLVCIPGVATPSEAFAALRAGADGLKLFPAGELVTPGAVKAMRAVMPKSTLLLPFGGITTANMKPWYDAGARAFGVGGALYKPGMDCAEIRRRAEAFCATWTALAHA